MPTKTARGKKLWVHIVGNPISENGELVKIYGSIQDITQRKETEQDLRESEAKFRTVFNQSPIGIEIYRADGMQIDANRASLEMFGISDVSEVLKFNLFDGTSLNEENRAKLKQGEIASYQATFDFDRVKKLRQYQTGKSGMAVFDYIISPMVDAERKLSGYLVLVQDVSERKRIENELVSAKERAEESDRLKSAFLANMSHEIRTPMNGILGFADLLKDPELSGEKQQKYLSVIEKSGERMLNTINNLIDISKIEAGQMTVSLSPVSVNEQINEVESFFREEAAGKGLEITCIKPLPESESVVETDAEKLYAVLANLVKNAIKFTPEGKVVCGYRSKGETFEFFVQDTGVGIPESRQAAVFDRFVQADFTLSAPFEGSGLGLAISKAYVEMLDGKMWLQSTEGKGTTFFFTIPAKQISSNKEPEISTSYKQQGNRMHGRLNILVVEDDEYASVYLDNILKPGLHKIHHAKTGSRAVEVMRGNPDIQLVLMDIKLPLMDGYEATRQIREFNKEAVIIAQTAFALAGDRDKALGAGCNDYISKPIKKDRLLEMLNKYF